jgi:hypothetical protein
MVVPQSAKGPAHRAPVQAVTSDRLPDQPAVSFRRERVVGAVDRSVVVDRTAAVDRLVPGAAFQASHLPQAATSTRVAALTAKAPGWASAR